MFEKDPVELMKSNLIEDIDLYINRLKNRLKNIKNKQSNNNSNDNSEATIEQKPSSNNMFNNPILDNDMDSIILY